MPDEHLSEQLCFPVLSAATAPPGQKPSQSPAHQVPGPSLQVHRSLPFLLLVTLT